MKNLLAVVLVLCLLAPCALSEEEDYDGAILAFAAEYNMNAISLFAVPELSLTCDMTEPDVIDNGIIAFWFDGDFGIGVGINEYWFGHGNVIALDGVDGADFLARCANVMYIIEELNTQNYAQLLHVYFAVRTDGEQHQADLYSGGSIGMTHTDGYWYFFVETDNRY